MSFAEVAATPPASDLTDRREVDSPTPQTTRAGAADGCGMWWDRARTWNSAGSDREHGRGGPVPGRMQLSWCMQACGPV